MAESENALINASGGEPECQRLLQDGQYVAWMAGLLRFARPLNCVMSAVGVGIGGGGGVGAARGGDPPLPPAFAGASAAAFHAPGHAPHQSFLIIEDRSNHTYRP